MGWNPNMGPSRGRSSSAASPFRLFLTLGWLAVISTAFVFGYQLAYHDADNALAEIQALKSERRDLKDRLIAAEEQVARLERAQSIDREAKRLAQAQLEELQHERHEFAKQVSALERLIREGGGGVVQVQDFELWETEQPDEFGYRFTVTQMIPEFGEASGRVSLRIDGKRLDDGKVVSRPARELEGSEPGSHRMQFEFFQHFSGKIRLPERLQPETLTVEIDPSVKNLISSSQTFAWEPEPADLLRLTQPADATTGEETASFE